MQSGKRIRICILDLNPEPMQPETGRGKEFSEVLTSLEPEVEGEWIHYKDLVDKQADSVSDSDHSLLWRKVLCADGLVLSGSSLNLSEKEVREEFEPIAEHIRYYDKPILGICFGHQLIAHAFGFLVRPMRPKYFDSEWWNHIQKAVLLTVRPGFPLIKEKEIWVEFNHHEEIMDSPEFRKVFEVFASTEACRIQIIAHRQRPIFGVQFHPETGKDPRARRDGQKIFEGFIQQIRLFSLSKV